METGMPNDESADKRLVPIEDSKVLLCELIKLANIQEERVLAMWAEERKLGVINPHLNTAIRMYKDLLLSIQKLRFDLGLDEYRRGKLLEGTSPAEVQQQVTQAIAEVEQIFEKDHIPKIIHPKRSAS